MEKPSDLPHVSDDEGLCMCRRCTDRLLAASTKYFKKWIKRVERQETTT